VCYWSAKHKTRRFATGFCVLVYLFFLRFDRFRAGRFAARFFDPLCADFRAGRRARFRAGIEFTPFL